MSESESVVVKPQAKRLKFIDVARTIAILLMLEGHFIDSMLAMAYRDEANSIYSTWHFIRGFTAPMFFTVTGLVFAYLLTRRNDEPFFKNIRVKKGFRRGFELIFWGYFIQHYIFSTHKIFYGIIKSGFYTFHVLQCIGVSLLVILLIYGLWKWLKFGPIWLYYFLAGTIVFSFYPYLSSFPQDHYLPEGAPLIIQNMIRGPRDLFALSPWLGIAMFGAVFGCLLNQFKDSVHKKRFPIIVILVGIFLNSFSNYHGFDPLDRLIREWYPNTEFYLSSMHWLFARIGQVFFVLGILMFIDKYINIKDSLFIKVGQNTLQIFIVHFIILYGGVFGWRLNAIWGKSKKVGEELVGLNPYEAAIGAILFIAFFFVFIKFLEPITAVYHKFLDIIFYPFRKLRDLIFKKA